MPGLLDSALNDPLSQLGIGLLGGQSSNFGQNLAQAAQYAQAMRLQQAHQAQLQQQLMAQALDLKAKQQSSADSDLMRSLGGAAPTDNDPYQAALKRYRFYQAQGVPESALRPYVEQIEKLKPKYHVVDKGLVAEPTSAGNEGVVAYQAPQDQWEDLGRDPVTGQNMQRNKKTGQLQAVGMKPTQVSQSVQTGETPFASQLGKSQAEEFFKMRTAAQRAAESLQTVNNMREAISSGAWQGGGAAVKASIANYLKPLGFQVDENKLANTQAFNSAAGTFLLQHAKDLGANPSNADAQRIKEIIGSADTDPQAMKKMLEWQEQMYRKTIRNYNSVHEQVKNNPKVFQAWDMGIQEPAPYAGGSSGALDTPTLRFDKNGKPL